MMRMLYVALSFVLICTYAATGWAVWEHRARIQWTKQAEAAHERSYNEWIDHLTAVEDRIDNAIAVKPKSPLYQTHMMHVWLAANEALGDIDQWPVAYGVTNNVRSALQHVRSTSYAHATHAQTSSAVWERMHRAIGHIVKKAKDVQDDLHAHHMVWASKKTALTDGWGAGSTMHALAQLDASIGRMQLVPVATKNKHHSLPKMSDAHIIAKAIALVHAKPNSLQRIVHDGDKTDAPTLSVHIKPNKIVEYLVHGGRLLTVDDEQPSGTARLSIAQAIARAEQFAQQHGFGNVETIGVDAYDQTVHVQVAGVREGVTIYPQRIAMAIARDDGRVVMLDASKFWAFTTPVALQHPKPTNIQADLDAHMAVLSTTEALIEHEGTYVQCYELLGRVHGSLIKVFVDMRSGAQIASEHVHEAVFS
ncbi:MAG: germination protein YpeB [Paenibacillaceae bacterium]|nr:germination protein YpeB [Paenibacillaceae bacterium]